VGALGHEDEVAGEKGIVKMISVADLIIDNRIPGNYFASDVYVRSELELGLLENR